MSEALLYVGTVLALASLITGLVLYFRAAARIGWRNAVEQLGRSRLDRWSTFGLGFGFLIADIGRVMVFGWSLGRTSQLIFYSLWTLFYGWRLIALGKKSAVEQPAAATPEQPAAATPEQPAAATPEQPAA